MVSEYCIVTIACVMWGGHARVVMCMWGHARVLMCMWGRARVVMCMCGGQRTLENWLFPPLRGSRGQIQAVGLVE